MGLTTNIEWCDSTLNAQMGCDGCELYNPKSPYDATCYAFDWVERHAGLKGYPVAFNQPTLFTDRIAKACKWPDLTGQDRPNKPWLNGYPRTIFLDDLGDTFTEQLPIDWLAPHIPAMESSSHIWIFLTKRPARMRQFFEQIGYVPRRFWLLTSVTSAATLNRADELLQIKGASVLGLSVEPLRGQVDLPLMYCVNCFKFTATKLVNNDKDFGCVKCGTYKRAWTNRRGALNWIIGGGESGKRAMPCHPDWARKLRDDCIDADVPFFWKQWGEYRLCTPEEVETCKFDEIVDGRKECGYYCDATVGHVDHNSAFMISVGKHKTGRLLDSREWTQMPIINK